MSLIDRTLQQRHPGPGMSPAKLCIACNRASSAGRLRRALWHCLPCVKRIDERKAKQGTA